MTNGYVFQLLDGRFVQIGVKLTFTTNIAEATFIINLGVLPDDITRELKELQASLIGTVRV